MLDLVRMSPRRLFPPGGVEPTEAEAVESMQLAVELLRRTVPNLQVRSTSRLLLL
jgi:hypothetical protein